MNRLGRLIEDADCQRLNRIFQKNNYKLLFVGGCVRDSILKRKLEDIDFATTAPIEEMMSWELKGIRVIRANSKHKTVIFIIEKEGGKPSSFEVTEMLPHSGSLEDRIKEDAKHRDFTINSLYLDFDGHLYDFYDGMQDIEKHRISFIDSAEDRIKEDPIRIMRFYRFWGQLKFKINSHQEKAIKENVHLLKNMPAERKWKEFRKGIMGNVPNRFFNSLYDCGAMRYIYKELYLLKFLKENKDFHKEGNTKDHTCLVFEKGISMEMESLGERLALIFHDIGKLKVERELRKSFKYYNHELLGLKLLKDMEKKYAFPKKSLYLSKCVIYNHMNFWRVQEMKISNCYDFVQGITENFSTNLYIESFCKCCLADKLGRQNESDTNWESIYEVNKRIINRFYNICKDCKLSNIDRWEYIPCNERKKALKEYRLNKIREVVGK